MFTKDKTFDSTVRYLKRSTPKELWKEARISALKKNQTVIQWMIEAIQEKIKRESK